MAAPVIQFKRGLLANLPGLRAGEPGFTTDSYDLYVGLTSDTSTNKFFGSHRYWTKGTASTGSGVNFVEGTTNGTQYVTLKAPDSLSGITTFTLPGADGSNGQFLKTNGSGTLSFADVSTNLSIAGGTGTDTVSLLTDTLTFAGTANEIETTVTNNQVQIGLPNDVIVGNALTVTGPAQFNGTVNLGNATGDTVTVVGLTTFTTSDVYISNSLYVGGLQVTGGGSAIGQDITTRNFKATGVSTFVGAVTFEGGTITLGDAATDNVVFAADVNSNIVPNTDAAYDFGTGSQRWRNGSFSGIVTATTFVGALTGTATSTTNIPNLTGAITSNNTTTSLGSFSSSDLATALTDETGSGAAVFANTPTLVTPVLGTPTSGTLTNCTGLPVSTGISGLGANVATFLATPSSANLASAVTDETGSGSLVFATSPTLVTPVLGAASATSIEVSGSVNVGTALSAPTVKTATVQHSNGTQAATIDSSGNITASQSLTVTGDLIVQGSTTRVDSTALTVEDRTIELGKVDGAVTTTTTWDLGVLFNYGDAGTARKSAVIWEHADSRFKFAKILDSDTDGTNANTPQLTITGASNYAAIEINALWINDCAGQSQVINCSGSTRTLENITIDGGAF
jgi:hypothetical protein